MEGITGMTRDDVIGTQYRGMHACRASIDRPTGSESGGAAGSVRTGTSHWGSFALVHRLEDFSRRQMKEVPQFGRERLKDIA